MQKKCLLENVQQNRSNALAAKMQRKLFEQRNVSVSIRAISCYAKMESGEKENYIISVLFLNLKTLSIRSFTWRNKLIF